MPSSSSSRSSRGGDSSAVPCKAEAELCSFDFVTELLLPKREPEPPAQRRAVVSLLGLLGPPGPRVLGPPEPRVLGPPGPTLLVPPPAPGLLALPDCTTRQASMQVSDFAEFAAACQSAAGAYIPVPWCAS